MSKQQQPNIADFPAQGFLRILRPAADQNIVSSLPLRVLANVRESLWCALALKSREISVMLGASQHHARTTVA